MTARLKPLDRLLRRRPLAPEISLLAALVVGLVPTLVWNDLQARLPALAVTVAAPADAPMDRLVAALHEASVAAIRVDVQPVEATIRSDLWSALWPELQDEGAPPHLLDAILWPATAIQPETLRRDVQAAVPDAVVEIGPRTEPQRPGMMVALISLGVGSIALLLVRTQRAVRRVLARESDALTLFAAFGARPDRIDRTLVRPLVTRMVRSSALGGLVGAAVGLVLLSANHGDALTTPWLATPWLQLATATAVALGTAVVLVRWRTVTLVRRRVRSALR
ncbi:MAG: hypothetical protein AAFX81_05015 [Pseudomonadota bacterium]